MCLPGMVVSESCGQNAWTKASSAVGVRKTRGGKTQDELKQQEKRCVLWRFPTATARAPSRAEISAWESGFEAACA